MGGGGGGHITGGGVGRAIGITFGSGGGGGAWKPCEAGGSSGANLSSEKMKQSFCLDLKGTLLIFIGML